MASLLLIVVVCIVGVYMLSKRRKININNPQIDHQNYDSVPNKSEPGAPNFLNPINSISPQNIEEIEANEQIMQQIIEETDGNNPIIGRQHENINQDEDDVELMYISNSNNKIGNTNDTVGDERNTAAKNEIVGETSGQDGYLV